MDNTVLFWDIDGTLLTTARAGIFAWEQALEGQVGRYYELSGFDTAGMTDIEIARELSTRCGSGSQLQIQRMVKSYEMALPAALPRKQGHVLNGAFRALEYFNANPEVDSFLLTGNTRRGAAAKLRHYGLLDLISNGAFGDDAFDRTGVAEVAMRVAEQYLGFRPSGEHTFVIGDTPKDIACGQTIGVRTIGVASGSYSSTELEDAGAWLVLENLSDLQSLCVSLGVRSSEASR